MNEKTRCLWAGDIPIYIDYHDNEWGRPVHDDIPASTPLSDKISKDLKRIGFKFVGSTIIYSFMQAVGMVNDHITDCFDYKECHVSGTLTPSP